MPVLVIGGTVLDIVFEEVGQLPDWPAHTEFTPANLALVDTPPIVTVGGNGANAAYAAARCGSRITLRTRLGRDAFGRIVRAELEAAGCRVVSPGNTRRTAVNVTAANRELGRATFFHSPPAPPLPSRVRQADQVLVCGWPLPACDALADWLASPSLRGCHRRVLDPGPFLSEPPTLGSLQPVLSALDLLILNAHELQALTRETKLESAVSHLRVGFAGDLVVKLGKRGACWHPRGKLEGMTIEAPVVRARNTIGAGDVFNGALLAALDAGNVFPAAIRFANQVAASVVRSPRGVLGLRARHPRLHSSAKTSC